MNVEREFSLEKVRKAHFVGIGGIGMSGLARILNKMKFQISGSDIKESHITEILRKEGIRVRISHSAANVPADADIVVTSSAIDAANPEVGFAFKKGIPVVRRARLLAELCRFKKTVTISGTHGKTTTTSMLSLAMDYAGANSTNVVGGIFKNINSNVKIGTGDYFVAEADESDGTFMYFSPLVACVTNIDNDHLDFYGNMENLKETFRLFISRVPFYGRAVICADDRNAMEVAKKVSSPYFTYGLSRDADWRARAVENGKRGTSFDVLYRGKKEGRVNLKVFGLHNVRNALCAYAAVKYLGFGGSRIIEGLENYLGVKRRIEFIGERDGVSFFDDYAHHPTEIENTLAALRSFYGKRRVVAVFQPHRYTRTNLLRKDFGGCFGNADAVYIMPVYPAGEKEIKGAHSGLILGEVRKNGKTAFPYQGAMEVAKNLRYGDIVVTLGAGDVWKAGHEIKLKLENLY